MTFSAVLGKSQMGFCGVPEQSPFVESALGRNDLALPPSPCPVANV